MQTNASVAQTTRRAWPQCKGRQANLTVHMHEDSSLERRMPHYFVISVDEPTVPILQFHAVKQDHCIYCQRQRRGRKIISNKKGGIQIHIKKNKKTTIKLDYKEFCASSFCFSVQANPWLTQQALVGNF